MGERSLRLGLRAPDGHQPARAEKGSGPSSSQFGNSAERDVFTADALTLLHEAAGSSPREIDRMATAALREAARRTKKLVERDVMAHIVGDLGTDGSWR
jgi:hypothetical protein